MNAARSWLFVPGDSARKIERALQGEADALIFDWEDSVVPAQKATAREVTVAALAASRPPPLRCWIRVNALLSPEFAADLAALPAAAIAGVMLPKCCGPADVERLGEALATVEKSAGITVGRLGIVGIATETAASVLALSDFRRPVPRLTGLMWGGEDLAGDLGVARNRDEAGRYREPFRLARSLVLLAAAAAECSAIDAVFVDVRDADAFAAECREGRADGFAAKAAVHPDQVGPINDAFGATADERAWAERVVVALAEHGVAVLDGRMIDLPHLRLARRILGR
ncbi:MAG: CoA ester lyase [Burkholderiales bacterium]|nr:CoA ester lyase [Burkholderiales bacterium]